MKASYEQIAKFYLDEDTFSRFMHNFKNLSKELEKNNVSDLDFLIDAFVWDDSREGHAFWVNISDNHVKKYSKIHNALNSLGLSISAGTIDFDWQNGWSDQKSALAEFFMSIAIKDSFKTYGEPSSKTTEFKVNLKDTVYNVVFKTDSGD